MTVYIDGVFLLNSLVDFLLVLGASRLHKMPVKIYRAIGAGVFGGLYAAACLLPGFHFLGNILWRIVSLVAISIIAYGISLSAIRRGILFVFLSLALGGAVTGLCSGGVVGIISAAGVLCLLCWFGFNGESIGKHYVPVELAYGGKRLSIIALHDTGNTLTDPITGRHVLVVGADVAKRLTGLTEESLRNPVESINKLPGLRLIPYKYVGGNGFMLAMRFSNVKIGKWEGSSLVAFAPEGLSDEGTYQALTGGVL